MESKANSSDDDELDPLEPTRVAGVSVAAVAAGVVPAPKFSIVPSSSSNAAAAPAAPSSSSTSASAAAVVPASSSSVAVVPSKPLPSRPLPALLAESDALAIVLESNGISAESHARHPQGARGHYLEIFQISKYRRIQGLTSFGTAVRHLEIMHQSQTPQPHLARLLEAANSNHQSAGRKAYARVARVLAVCVCCSLCRSCCDRGTASTRQPRNVSAASQAGASHARASSNSLAHSCFFVSSAPLSACGFCAVCT